MKKKRDLRKTLSDIQREIEDGKGARYTFWLSTRVYFEFKKLCGDVSVSAVLERWMRDAIEDFRSGEKLKKRKD